jgi:PAS domain S-box-containing protein
MEEAKRLEAIRKLGLSDLSNVADLDALTELAKTLFQVDIALITVVDELQQVFVSKQGIEASGTPRNISFCTHAIEQSDVYIVEDASQQALFKDNPLVTGDPKIRFYAGAPLKSNQGAAYGTLCLIDKKPRALTDGEAASLQLLSKTAVSLLESAAHKKLFWQSAAGTEASSLLSFEAALLGHIVERANTEVFVFGADDMRFIYANAGARENLGYSGDELKTITPYDIKPDVTEAEFRKAVQPLIDGKINVLCLETVHQRKDGTTYDVELKAEYDSVSSPPVFIAFTRDITIEKMQRQKIEGQLNEMRQFNSILAHDLSSPLRHAYMFSELLVKTSGQSPETVDYAKTVQRSVQKSQDMLQTLSRYTQLGKEGVPFETIDLNAVVLSTIADMKQEIEAENATLTIEPLPSISGNGVLMGQLFQNLVQNSLKYASDAAPEITISATETARYFTIYFQDNGIGIEEKYAEQIFEIFKRLPDKNKQVPGQGIGLSTVKKITELHNGRIRLDTNYQGGARFVMVFSKA